MFDILTNLTKAVVNTAVLPVTVVQDVVTLGRAADDEEPYTVEQLKKVMKNLNDAGS